MSTLSRILAFVRSLLAPARQVKAGDDEVRYQYNRGYIDALEEVEEWILDEEWAEGEDDEEDPN